MTLTQRLSQATKEQREVITASPNEPLLLIATAGSGKTSVLEARAGFLIEELGMEPDRLMITTFTKNAAKEIEERVANLIGDRAHNIRFGTIHSICLSILRARGPVDVVTGGDAATFMGKARDAALDKLGLSNEDVAGSLGYRFYDQWISWAKEQGYGGNKKQLIAAVEAQMRKSRPSFPMIEQIAEMVGETAEFYARLKGKKIDFTDMIVDTKQLLMSNALWRRRIQNSIDHVMVDEVQDTSRLQSDIIQYIAKDKVTMVGDADQSLYRFRNADPKSNIWGFRDRYPNGKIKFLTVNFRSTPPIIDAAQGIIRHNYDETNAEYQTKKHSRDADFSQARAIRVSSYHSDLKEAAAIAEEIAAETGTGDRRYKDYAVLFRTNAQSQPVEAALIEKGIPFINRSGSFFLKRRVQDCLAYLKLAMDTTDDASFLRVYDIPSQDFVKPTRYLGRKFIESLTNENQPNLMEATQSYYEIAPPYRRTGIEDLNETIKNIQLVISWGTGPQEPLSYITKLYKAYEMKRNGVSDVEELEELDQLVASASLFETEEAYLKYVSVMIEYATKQRDASDEDAVILSTIHGAKGLEWPVVYAIGMAEGVMPHWMATGDTVGRLARSNMPPAPFDSEVSDERCTAFVTVTRAQEELRVSWSKQVGKKTSLTVSRFLMDAGLEVPQVQYAIPSDDIDDLPVSTQELQPHPDVKP